MNRFLKATLLVKELGVNNLLAYACYRFQLKSGYLTWRFPIKPNGFSKATEQFGLNGHPGLLDWDSAIESNQEPNFIDRSEDLLKGAYRPFGGDPAPLSFSLPDPDLQHWTVYNHEYARQDIKLTWEPARFGWCYPLLYSWRATRNDQFPQYLWHAVEQFLEQNPVNQGPNWASAQELALRSISWLIALDAIRDAPATTSERVQVLLSCILYQVDRIPVTIHYARAQHNNHLLSEALALMVAGDFFSDQIPQAARWAAMGEGEFEHGILDQVEPNGTYSQQSANYHRLMLQLALIYIRRMEIQNKRIPQNVRERLAAATRWTLAQMDPVSGWLPNLGHNDGAQLLPIGSDQFRDFRPTLQAASLAFLGEPALPPGKWDFLSILLRLNANRTIKKLPEFSSPAIMKVGKGTIWGTVRAVNFRGRPAHADQLHVDLWWDGKNIARDPGTYLYNGTDPWTNALDRTGVHNTVTVDNRDQMERISRFLWLDLAQATGSQQSPMECSASHNGYRELSVIHHRTLSHDVGSGFSVMDYLETTSPGRNPHKYTLHWLLPDWKWRLDENTLVLSTDQCEFRITIKSNTSPGELSLEPISRSLIRAGVTLHGTLDSPIHGWESITYAQKQPAISYLIEFESNESIEILTHWELRRA